MSEYGTGQPSSAGGSAAGTAKNEAAGVARSAAQSGQHLASEAKTQAAEVGREAGRQAKDVLQGMDILQMGKSQVTGQLSAQHDKAADALRTLSKELQAMASGESTEAGLGADVARQVSQRVESVAAWIESHEPSEVLDEVKRFARSRPGTFLAIAAGTGLLAGRMARGIKDVNSDDTAGQGQPEGGGTYGSTYGTGPTYDSSASVGTGAEYATVTSGTMAGTAAGAPIAGVEGGLGESAYASTGYGTEGSTDDTLAYGGPTAGTYGGGETTQVPERQGDDLSWPPVHGEGEQR